jgi:hypothetical protein
VASGRFGGLEKPVKRKERAESVRVLFLGGTASEAANLPRAIERITREHGHKLADSAICLPILGRVCRISAGRERFGAPKSDGVK